MERSTRSGPSAALRGRPFARAPRRLRVWSRRHGSRRECAASARRSPGGARARRRLLTPEVRRQALTDHGPSQDGMPVSAQRLLGSRAGGTSVRGYVASRGAPLAEPRLWAGGAIEWAGAPRSPARRRGLLRPLAGLPSRVPPRRWRVRCDTPRDPYPPTRSPSVGSRLVQWRAEPATLEGARILVGWDAWGSS